jgi:KaiC/GvpD/RAD55 family RecA-like ATPase
MLKGKKPELIVPSKPKFMISGDPGTGKTMFALNWDAPFYCDTERGATRKQYTEKLIAGGGAYFGPEDGSQDFREVINQVRELATTEHKFRSLVIDSFSKLYNLEAASAEERVGADFGKDKREANKPARQLMRWIERLDLSVVLVCHSKEKWIRQERELLMVGKTYDGPPKLSFDLDLWIEAKLVGNKRYATIIKSRIEGFPVGQDIALDVETFKKLYGESVINAPSKAITLASSEQVAEIKRIVELLKISDEDVDKLLAKGQAVEIEDLSKENATKFLTYLEAKLKGEKK